MADWPTSDELKALVDVENTEDWNELLEISVQAGIDRVKTDVGGWDDDVDEPDESLHNAALRAAIVGRINAGEAVELETDKIYLAYLKGHRREFGIA